MENLYLATNGIRLQNVTNGLIQDSVFNGYFGIRIFASSSVTVRTNSFTGLLVDPVSVYDSHTITITQNSISNSPISGIYISGSDAIVTLNSLVNGGLSFADTATGTISQNNITDGRMELGESGSVSVTNNRLIRSGMILAGIPAGSKVQIAGNTMIDRGIEFYGLAPVAAFTVSTTNTVNGKPVLFYSNCHDLKIDGAVMGQLILLNCQRVTLNNINLTLTDVGVYVAAVDELRLQNSKLVTQVVLQQSSSIRVLADEFRSNSLDPAITVDHGTNFTLAESTVSSTGARIVGSVSLNVTDNIFSNNSVGLQLESDTQALVQGNEIANNSYGISVRPADYTSGSGTGLNITTNQIAQNQLGIWIQEQPTSSKIDHNNFVYNTKQALGEFGSTEFAGTTPSSSLWGNGYPSGGNYWSDYTGVDHCSGPAQDQCSSPDGLGDTPYTISTSCYYYLRPCIPPIVDQYPSMHLFGNFPQPPPPTTQPPTNTGGNPNGSGTTGKTPNPPKNPSFVAGLLQSLGALPPYAYPLIAVVILLGIGLPVTLFRTRKGKPQSPPN